MKFVKMIIIKGINTLLILFMMIGIFAVEIWVLQEIVSIIISDVKKIRSSHEIVKNIFLSFKILLFVIFILLMLALGMSGMLVLSYIIPEGNFPLQGQEGNDMTEETLTLLALKISAVILYLILFMIVTVIDVWMITDLQEGIRELQEKYPCQDIGLEIPLAIMVSIMIILEIGLTFALVMVVRFILERSSWEYDLWNYWIKYRSAIK